MPSTTGQSGPEQNRRCKKGGGIGFGLSQARPRIHCKLHGLACIQGVRFSNRTLKVIIGGVAKFLKVDDSGADS